ncbi:MAG TPA: alanine racemase [Aeromicrobium sp.]|nr:alanine racemase [Aeromicrobium sp.]HKY56583.1 alanine racemase [Aeromicrobium sp.]
MTSPQAEAVIDLDAYRANLRLLGDLSPTAALLAVVKANAYGHGMAACARAAREADAAWLGVATVDEALELRSLGDTGPVLCWLNAPGADYAAAIDADIEVTASSAEQLREIGSASVGLSQPARVQLKVDTGLSRNGALGEQWVELVETAATEQALGRIVHTGTWSHFACADEPDHPGNDAQEAAFMLALEVLAAHGLEPGLRHLANSAAAIARPSSHLDLVRVGIASYGLPPSPTMQVDLPLRPVMTLRGRLAAVKRVPAGSGVSYGWTHTTERETTLGLVPLGYGEGIPRHASGRLSAAHGGRRVPQVGIVAMDQFVVDLGDAPAQRGDLVTLFGPGDDGEPTAEDWAAAADTIGYEVVTRVGGRVRRTYRGVR